MCQKTCIDHILCNSFVNLIVTGSIPNYVSHHHPIFTISYIANTNPDHSDKITIYYEYSQENLSKLKKELENKIGTSDLTSSFETFNSGFNECLDKTCKLKNQKPLNELE